MDYKHVWQGHEVRVRLVVLFEIPTKSLDRRGQITVPRYPASECPGWLRDARSWWRNGRQWECRVCQFLLALSHKLPVRFMFERLTPCIVSIKANTSTKHSALAGVFAPRTSYLAFPSYCVITCSVSVSRGLV